MPASLNTRESSPAPCSQQQISCASHFESTQAGQHEETLEAVVARSLQSRAPSTYDEPIQDVIARYLPDGKTPPRVDLPPLPAPSPQPGSSQLSTLGIPASAYLRPGPFPHKPTGKRRIPYIPPDSLQRFRRSYHTKALFHANLGQCARAMPPQVQRPPKAQSTVTYSTVPLLGDTPAQPSIVLTGPQQTKPTMPFHTWEDLGGDAYKAHKVAVAIPRRLGLECQIWRRCKGRECNENGKGMSLRCEECYARAWLNFEVERAWRVERIEKEWESEDSDSDSDSDSGED